MRVRTIAAGLTALAAVGGGFAATGGTANALRANASSCVTSNGVTIAATTGWQYGTNATRQVYSVELTGNFSSARFEEVNGNGSIAAQSATVYGNGANGPGYYYPGGNGSYVNVYNNGSQVPKTFVRVQDNVTGAYCDINTPLQ